MKCEECPAGWEDRSYEGECNACGCLILGNDMFDDKCKLSANEIDKRLAQLKAYEEGKIDRPQWVANRFIRELDDKWQFGHSLGIFLPGFPPPRMHNGCYESIFSGMGLNDSVEMIENRVRRNYEEGARTPDELLDEFYGMDIKKGGCE